ncbi:E3 ubiquitin-protein ligase upl4 [Trifolium repens]|nr:E3 ubiquitin-protein ligase upl4 [Trifolium repens]
MGSKWDIEKFTGNNDFGLWKVKMKALLIHHKCVEALKGIAQKPATLSDQEKKDMDEKALSSIILCLGDKVLREVAKETSAAAMWTKLDSLYMTKSLAHKQLLKQQLYFFRMVENKSFGEQLSEFNKIVDDLANIDVNLEDEDKAFHLLCAFPKSLENLKDALLFGKEGTITLDEVQSTLRTKELSKFKDLKIEDNGEGLNVARGRSEYKGKGNGKKYRSKSRPKGDSGSKFKCYHCHEPGHFKKDCPQRKGGGSSSAQIATSDEGYESAGALAEYFETLELKEDGVVRLGNDKACKVQGYNTRIERGVMRISHGALVIAKGSKMNGLYILEGHVSERGLVELAKQGLLGKEKLNKLDFCDNCTLGKQHKVKFGVGVHKSSRSFEYVHSDLWGPASVSTHGGEQFNEFCRLKGIKSHITVAYTPQQNGLAERMNMTLLERVRCMLLGAGLPKSFWGEAVNTAAYLINRCPSIGIDLKTPMEQDKLDARAVKCVFIGYPDGVKGYKLWMMGPGRSKFIISRDFEVEPSTDEREKEDQTQVPEESGSDEPTTSDYQLARDRERRVIRPPNRLGYADLICYALNAAEEVQDSEPKNFREALESIDGKDWLKAMNEEMLSLEKN